MMLDPDTVGRFRTDGFVVIRGAIDPTPIAQEIDRALADGLVAAGPNSGSAGNEFRYLPMMCERTPVSLDLIDALAGPAADLLGCAVVPGRAKGTEYFTGSAWHRDSDIALPSVGFVAYLDALDSANGALRVRPGSHIGSDSRDAAFVATNPGDVIAFDEHLEHGSIGGAHRRQWRVDFMADPVGVDEEAIFRGYVAAIYAVGWDGGYDVDRYPSYGPNWRAADRPWTERLRALGVYDRADEQEDAMRQSRLRREMS